ncbi:oxygenase MpaB family protein [Modestobacter italicus]|uniref:oxygenase MpaB family protein n=1 Tax=Modestobacter italicus (strain DSM 44449 / CECT 9708 / BC 501) TaxID=2732864 RepID=UPI001C986D98|nr:oxygenase MpaB family protein [Modestobacter italicus]
MIPTPSVKDFTPEEDLLGFFGPDSVSWRIHSDPAFSVGGIRALLLQALHPVAMDGVHRFSTAFATDPWARLTRTAEYVATLTFGTRRDALRQVRRVRGLHRDKSAVEETTGRHYRVDDADLLLWVHNCEVESLLSTARRAGVPLTDAEADRYVEEQVVAAVLVGCEETDVPRTVAELDAYFAGVRARLAVTPAARSASRFVLLPPMPGWVQLLTPARPAWSTLASLGAATLPGWARRLYGLPGFAVTDAAATAGLRAFRQTALAVPARVRESPIVRAARERVAGAEPLTA